MGIINFVCDIINSSWFWLATPILLGWTWIAKTAADDVLCSHINDLQTKKVDTDWKDYKARAYRDGNQENIPDQTWTKIELNAETYDPGGNFDHAVNYRFTAPIAGYYLVAFQVKLTDVVADKRYTAKVYKNGDTDIFNTLVHSSHAEKISIVGTDIMELAQGDFIELWIKHWAGVGTIDIATGTVSTHMALHILSI